MKKVTLFIICLVFLPSITSAYVPTDAELKSSIYNYIGNENQRQQYQDIIDNQNNSYNQLFGSYYQSVDNLEKEYQLKLKEIELEKDSKKREELWQKEKAILDRELELIRKEQVLMSQQKTLEINKNSQDLVQYMQGVTDQIIKDRELKEKSEIKNTTDGRIKTPREIKPFQYEKSVTTGGSSEVNDLLEGFQNNTPAIEPTANTPIEVPAPKRNIFYRFWSKIINFF